MAGGSAIEQLKERVAELEDQVATLLAAAEASTPSASREFEAELGALGARLDSVEKSRENEMVELRKFVEDLTTEVAVLKMAIRVSGSSEKAHKKVPNPSSFGGSRSAKDLENFLWDMEQYFQVAHIDNAEQVTTACMFLCGDAKLWWRNRVEDATRPKVMTWAQMKEDLREQFLPCNVAWLSRESLRKLKHTGSVREYVKAFQSLMLNVKNMSEDDKLFNFMSGLQSWAQTELRRQGVRDLASAVAAADSLVDYNGGSSGCSRKQAPLKDNGKAKEDQEGKSTQPSKYRGPNSGCFICSGAHRAKDCPQKRSVASIVTEGDEEVSQMGALRLVNVMTQVNASKRGLLYVLVKLNGHEVCAMVDTGATNNFISVDCAAHYGLSLVKDDSRVKAVNSKAQPVVGVTKNVDLVVGEWKGKVNVTSFSFVDYDLILGLDWMLKAQVIVAPHLRGMLITCNPCPCFVHGFATQAKRNSVERVSALVLLNSQEEGAESFMANLDEEVTLGEGALKDERKMVYVGAMKMIRQDVLKDVESLL